MKLWMGKVLVMIFERSLKQGYHHKDNLLTIHRLLRNALCREFTEDSRHSLYEFSRECHDSVWEEINVEE